MQKLDEWKAWDNTLVIFMTDSGQAGRSGKKNGKRQALFTHCGRWEKGAEPNLSKDKKFAVRSQRWRLVGDTLYDISKDPYEASDVASQHPEVVSNMKKAYDAWWSETRPLMVNEDLPYAKEHPQDVRYEKQFLLTGRRARSRTRM